MQANLYIVSYTNNKQLIKQYNVKIEFNGTYAVSSGCLWSRYQVIHFVSSTGFNFDGQCL